MAARSSFRLVTPERCAPPLSGLLRVLSCVGGSVKKPSERYVPDMCRPLRCPRWLTPIGAYSSNPDLTAREHQIRGNPGGTLRIEHQSSHVAHRNRRITNL